MISIKHVFIIVTGAAYLGMGYIATSSRHPPLITIFLGLVPLGAVAFATAWKAKARTLFLLLCSACAMAIVINLNNLRDHAAWLYFIQHAGAMSILCITFGSTLRNGHAGALCSRIASFVIPKPLDADYFYYTWKVTVAWAVYFAVSALVSVLLFFFGPIEVWSIFANLLTPVSLGAMFVGEYLIRMRLMPDGYRVSVSAAIQGYREYSQRQDTQ